MSLLQKHAAILEAFIVLDVGLLNWRQGTKVKNCVLTKPSPWGRS